MPNIKRRNAHLAKRETEVLCELDLLEPVIEWREEENLEPDMFSHFEFGSDNEEIFPLIPDLHEWLNSSFTFDDVPDKL